MSLKDERQPERTAGACPPLYEGNSYGLAATFGLGSLSVVFTHLEVCRARAINIQLYTKSQFTERFGGGRDFVPC